MEVTKSNFYELLPEIVETIKDSTFVCIDTEFTGLTTGNNEPSALDTPAQYYKKILEGSLNFICIQFGFVAFKLDSDTKTYSCRAYNCFTFPRPEHHYAADTRFLCQASSIDFLISNGFDFNKLFKEGISYMNVNRHGELAQIVSDKKQYREANKNSHKDSPAIKIPPQHKKVVDEACAKLVAVISPDSPTDEVKVDGCNGFIRKLIYQTIRERYSVNELSLETKDGVLISKKGKTDKELEEEAKRKEEAEQEAVQKAFGFSDVIKALSNSGKLIIGHNVLLDLCHLTHEFMVDLPNDYSEFKETVRGLFPWILDTKYLASSDELSEHMKSTVLNHLYQATSENPFIRPDISFEEGYGYPPDSSKFHEAAFDAYITGVSFISMYNYLVNPENASINAPVYETSRVLTPLIKKFVNRLHLMRTPDSCIYLDGKDPKPNRDHVFHLKFPKSWVQQNIVQLFSPFGNVQIWWLTETSAWVGLNDKREIARAIKSLCSGNSLPVGVVAVPYSKYANSATASKDSSSCSARAGTKRPSETPTSPVQKKRKSSWDTSRLSIDPIPEESEDSEEDPVVEEKFKERCIKELEKGIDTSENWG